MFGLAGSYGGQGPAILGIVPHRHGLGAALALCSLECLPCLPACLPWLSLAHLEPTGWLPMSDRQLRNTTGPRAPVATRWHIGGRRGSQDSRVHVGDMAWHGGMAWQTASLSSPPSEVVFGFGFESLEGSGKACDSPGWRLVLDTTIWHSLRPGEPGAARNRKHGVRGQTSSNIPENERVLEGQDAVRAEGGDGVLLEAACVGSTRHPAAAARCYDRPGSGSGALSVLAARLGPCRGLQWSGLLVRLCVCVCAWAWAWACKWVDGKTMAFAPEPGPCTPIIQTDRQTDRQSD